MASLGYRAQATYTPCQGAGGTTAAARAHVAERLIQRHDGWKSASSKNCYISDPLEDALSVSRAVLQ